MRRFSAIPVALLFLLWVTVAQAFSSSDVQRYVATIEQILPLVDDEDYDDDLDFEVKTMQEYMSLDWLTHEHLKEVEGRPELERIIRSNGFSSLQAWADVGARVERAFFALSTADRFEASLQEARDMLDQATSAAEGAGWQQVERQILMAREIVASVPASELEAVRPHMARLQELFDDEDDWDEED